MNSKGNYPVALVITVLICCIWLAVSISGLYGSVGDRFGVVQSAVLDLAGDMRLVESQLKLSADMSLDDALRELPKSPQVGRGCDLGSASYEGLFCPVIIDTVGDVCTPDVLSSFNDIFNSRMDGFISRYNSAQPDVSMPLNSLDVMPFAGYSSIVSTRPAFITMRDLGGLMVGNASFRPAFKLERSYLREYNDWVAITAATARACSSASDMESCVSNVVPPGVRFASVGDNFVLVFPYRPSDFCLAWTAQLTT